MLKMNSQNGLTLIELMITLAILGIVMTAVISLFISTNKVYLSNSAILEMQQDVRLARSLLINDLIKIKKSLTSCGSDGLGNDDHIFDLDVNSGNFVRKNVSNNNITRTIMYDPEKIEFTCLDSEWQTTNIPSDIRAIQVKICGRLRSNAPLLSENYQYCVLDAVTLRHLYY